MMNVLRSADRGRSRLGWLDSFHTFSFGEYHDPERLGFRDLRVINEDRVAPGEGFGRHPHRDMEIVSYVLEGSLSHRDSLGTGSVIGAGEFQVMSAGTGVTHSEFNASTIAPVHFLQIWILPERRGLAPRYDQRAFPEDARRGRLAPMATPDGRDGSLRIFQDAALYAGSFAAGEKLAHSLAPGRHAWLQVVRGGILLNGSPLDQGDGASLSDATRLTLEGREDSEILLFDLR